MLLALVYAALQFVFMWWLSAYSYNVDSAAAAVEAGALGGGLNDAVVAEVAGGAGGAAVAAAVEAAAAAVAPASAPDPDAAATAE